MERSWSLGAEVNERGCPWEKGVIIALNADGDEKAGRRTQVEQSGRGEEGAPLRQDSRHKGWATE